MSWFVWRDQSNMNIFKVCSEKRKAHGRNGFLITSFCFLLTSCGTTDGKTAVEQLCRLDGGLRVAETTNADGYLDMTAGNLCLACLEWLGNGHFSYVDFYVPNDGKGPLVSGPGYFRVTSSKEGDPRCSNYERAIESGQLSPAATYGLSAGRCFAVDRLPGKPEGIVYERNYGKVLAPNGAQVGFDELRVFDSQRNVVLATSKNYSYVSPISRLLDMSGGGGTADADCRATTGIEVPFKFLEKVIIANNDQSPGVNE